MTIKYFFCSLFLHKTFKTQMMQVRENIKITSFYDYVETNEEMTSFNVEKTI
jgi:hypothetical protein